MPNTKSHLKNVEIIKFKKDTSLTNSFGVSFKLFDGLKIVPTYGYTVGHVSVLLNNGNNYIFFTGDTEFDGTTCKNKIIRGFQIAHRVQCLGNYDEVLINIFKT